MSFEMDELLLSEIYGHLYLGQYEQYLNMPTQHLGYNIIFPENANRIKEKISLLRVSYDYEKLVKRSEAIPNKTINVINVF